MRTENKDRIYSLASGTALLKDAGSDTLTIDICGKEMKDQFIQERLQLSSKKLLQYSS